MRRTLTFLLLAAACTTPPAPPPKSLDGPLAPRVLFERHLRAVGGERVLKAKTKATVRFAVSYPDRGVEGTGALTIADGKASVVMELEGIGRVEKTNDEGWATDIQFDAHLAEHFKDAKTIGKSTLDGIEVYEVSANASDGPVKLTFDASGGELVAKQQETKTDDGVVTSTTRFADYQDFGGFRLARIITQRTGDHVQVIRIQAVELQ